MWLAEEKIKFIRFPPRLPVLAIVLRKAVPPGQLLYSVSEQRIFIAVRLPRFTEPLDAAFQIAFKIIEAEHVP